MKLWRNIYLLISSLLCLSCSVSPPKGVRAVKNFSIDRYLGTWYEVARLDNRFERGLDHITATYALNPDGSLKVINQGFSATQQQWRRSIGKAQFLDSPHRAALKVSFFWPFYGGYHVIALDPEYRYALVAGPSRNYLWLLSRTPKLDNEETESLLKIARELDYPADNLIWVKQE
ncbi:MAG: lipocalin family protein [Candidatus Arsenophonus phytopathogenicus]